MKTLTVIYTVTYYENKTVIKITKKLLIDLDQHPGNIRKERVIK